VNESFIYLFFVYELTKAVFIFEYLKRFFVRKKEEAYLNVMMKP